MLSFDAFCTGGQEMIEKHNNNRETILAASETVGSGTSLWNSIFKESKLLSKSAEESGMNTEDSVLGLIPGPTQSFIFFIFKIGACM